MRYFIAVLLLSGVLFVPAANANSCPGADPCPWTKIDSFGDVGIGEFRAPLGMAADAAGNIYVLEQDANRVQKLNSSGSSLAVWGSIGSSDGELHEPSDIAIDPTTASVYVTDQDNNRIERFDTAGKFVAIWGWGVADGSAAYQVCTSNCRAGTSGSGPGQTSAPAGVATDGTTVYVAEWSNKRIEKFDLDGGFAGQWPIPGGEHPARVTVTAGKVYVSTAEDHVWRFDQNGTPDNTWDGDGVAGSHGSGPGQFNGPEAIAADGSSVYVTDTLNNRVQKLDLNGGFQTAWGTPGSADGQFYQPWGVLLAGGGVWVTDAYNHRLQKFSQAGAHQLTVGSIPGAGEFYFPSDVVTLSSGGVYVADSSGKDIQRLDESGNTIARWATGNFPHSVTPTAAGVYVSETGHHVSRYDGAGSLLGQFGSAGSGLGQLAWPLGTATDHEGNLYVADSNNNRIQKFSPAGAPLAAFGSQGLGDGQLYGPADVALDSTGNVYVVDGNNSRIEKFSPSGAYLATFGGSGSGDGQLLNPRGVAVDAAGDVFVADSGHSRIQEFDAGGKFITKWGSLGSGPGELAWPVGLSIGAGGAIWVADENNHRIVRFCCVASDPAPNPDPGGGSTPPGGDTGAPDRSAPVIKLTGRTPQRSRLVRKRGLGLRVAANERADVSLAVVVSKRDASRLGLRSRTVGRATARLDAAGGRGLRLRLSARAGRAIRRVSRLRLVVHATAADRAGNRSGATRAITVKR